MDVNSQCRYWSFLIKRFNYTKFLNVKFTLQKVNNINRGNFTIIIMNREISFSRVVFPFALKETVPQIHLFIIFQASMKDFLQKRDSKKEEYRFFTEPFHKKDHLISRDKETIQWVQSTKYLNTIRYNNYPILTERNKWSQYSFMLKSTIHSIVDLVVIMFIKKWKTFNHQPIRGKVPVSPTNHRLWKNPLVYPYFCILIEFSGQGTIATFLKVGG